MSETYISVANQLEGRIRDLDVGDRVPSENDVVREFEISRPTARAALQELERRFVVRRVKGSGTFVNERIPYPIGHRFPPSVSQTLALSGRTPHWRLVTVSETEPEPCELQAFAPGRPGRLIEIGRALEVDGDVIGFGVSKIANAMAPGLRRHLDDISSIWRILDTRYGIRLVRRTVEVSLDTPPHHVGHIIETREPTWHLRSVNVDSSTLAVVELGESWIRTDRVAVSVHFDHSDDESFEIHGVTQGRSEP